jgi:hypothetical protein
MKRARALVGCVVRSERQWRDIERQRERQQRARRSGVMLMDLEVNREQRAKTRGPELVEHA